MKTTKAIAVLCSDLHLTLQQPACRADANWMDVQTHYLNQLRKMSGSIGPWVLPVVCAGDIFDRWNASPELINFALQNLPSGMICVPGQHDLPNHQYDQMHRSGFGVLFQAGKIKDVSGMHFVGDEDGNFVVHGFAWGEKLEPFDMKHESSKMPRTIHLAVIHQYMWLGEESKYPGAPEESSFAAAKKILKTYDAVVIGDNHKGWRTNYPGSFGQTSIMNCGTFIRRKSDEIQYRPAVGILYSDGTIERKYLDTTIDKFHADAKVREETAFDMQDFIDGLEKLGEHGLNFREAVENHLRTEKMDKETKRIILQALEERR